MGRERLSAALSAAVLYFVLASGTVWLSSDLHEVPPIWPANAVLLAMLLQPKRVAWSDMLLISVVGNFLANLVVSGAHVVPIIWGLIDATEVMIAAYALRRAIGADEVLGAPENVGRFLLWAGIIAPIVGGLGGATVTWLWYDREFVSAFRLSFFSDALGMLVFTPFFTSLLGGEYWRVLRNRSKREYFECIAIVLLVSATAVLVFIVARRPIAFILFAPLMLAAFRLGRLGTQFALLIVAVAGSIGVYRPQTTFAIYGEQPELRLHLVQFFLAMVLLTCLPVAASLSARARLLRQLADSERRLRAREADLIRLAGTDPLTGLMHRGALNERIEAVHYEERIAVAVLDLDRFKDINDRFGHDVGDRALVHFARVIANGVRQGDVVARIGGDEFMIFFPATDQGIAASVCDRLATVLRDQPLPIDNDASLFLAMSCGVAERRDDETVEALIKRADQALYAAKEAGRSRVLRAA